MDDYNTTYGSGHTGSASASNSATIGDLARRLWGDPTTVHRDELRFGTNGSKSLKPKLGVWFDHEANEGGGYRDLYKRVHGSYPGNGPDRSGFHIPPNMLRRLGSPVGWWDYHDETGAVVGRAVRFEPPGKPRDETGKPAKEFLQFRPNGAGWAPGLKGIQLPLYRLPELLHAPAGSFVYLNEGEKHADALRDWGLLATSAAGGSGKFRADHADTLAGLTVLVLGDNDSAGRKHVTETMKVLRQAGVTAFELRLPNLPPKGDVIDWIAAGGTREALEQLTEAVIQLPPDAEDARTEPPPEPEPTKPQSQIGRLRIYSDDDLLTLPPRDYLVKGWLCPGEISLLVGAKNARKTFLALHVGRAVAQGRSVFGRRVKQAPVLYVVCEGEAGIAKRVQALAQRYGRTDNFHVIAQPLDLLRSTATEGDLSDLIEAAQVYKVGLIVVDTVSRVMNGGEENGPADMGALLGNLNLLRHATGAHVQGIHHGTQEDGTKSRGHSSLPNGADAIAQVAWGGDISGMGTVTLGFARDDETGSIGAFRTEKVELGVDADGDPISTLLIEEANADEPASVAPKKGLNEEAISLHRHMVDLMDRYGQPAQPLPGMDPIPTIDRKFFHQCLIDRGWLLTDKLTTTTGTFSEKLTDKLTGDGGEEKVPDREWVRLHKRLTSLQIKGIAYFNRRYVWLGKP